MTTDFRLMNVRSVRTSWPCASEGAYEGVVHREKAALLDSPAVLFVRQPSCPGASTAAAPPAIA